MLLNCSTVNGRTSLADQNSQIQREWMLVSFGDYTKSDLMKNGAQVNLTQKAEHNKIKGTAFMGCNSMFFTSEFKNSGDLKISEIGSTLKACQEMKLETDFAKTFRNMTKYTIKGHMLTVTDDQGNKMEFIAADWD